MVEKDTLSPANETTQPRRRIDTAAILFAVFVLAARAQAGNAGNTTPDAGNQGSDTATMDPSLEAETANARRFLEEHRPEYLSDTELVRILAEGEKEVCENWEKESPEKGCPRQSFYQVLQRISGPQGRVGGGDMDTMEIYAPVMEKRIVAGNFPIFSSYYVAKEAKRQYEEAKRQHEEAKRQADEAKRHADNMREMRKSIEKLGEMTK